MKRVAFFLGLLLVLAATPAVALPTFSLGGYTGPITIKFKNFESFSSSTISPEVENFGVVNVTNITDPIGNNLFVSGPSSGFLAGVFADVEVKSVTPISGGFDVKSKGGVLDLYFLSAAPNPGQGLAGYAAAGCSPGDLCYHTISDTVDGILFLKLQFASGVDPSDGTVTVDGTFTTTTLPASGHAVAFADVIGGAFAASFDSNAFLTAFGARDVFFQNDFCPNGAVGCGGPVGNWQLLSDDPARAVFISQPATLLLLGSALLGLTTIARRRVR